jgi:crotonobetainyl-CoA:carnitine CoA-transferase CaiB-like acyl-CoA transferase
VPCSPVNDIGQVADCAQMQAMELLHDLPEGGPRIVNLPLSFDGARPRPYRDAPKLGAHNRELLGRD